MEIEIWDNCQMQKHLDAKQYPTEINPYSEHKLFVGFRLFGPDFIYDRCDTEYRESTNGLARVSIETYPEDRHLVALNNEEIVSLASFMRCNGEYGFWHYCIRFIETKKENQNQGIAKSLVRRLIQPCFLHDEILMIGCSYTSEGRKYIKHVLERELKGAPFSILDGGLSKLELYEVYKSIRENEGKLK